jgi:hypothetical protein
MDGMMRWGHHHRVKRLLFLFDIFTYYEYQETIGKATNLLQELAIVDGRILIDNMPIMLLNEAILHFEKSRRGGQKLLSIFGKYIRALIGFSSSIYELELPNMQNFEVPCAPDGTAGELIR